MIVLYILMAFAIKHFLCDFPLQACPWMYKNKGIYGHWGGIAHAYIHLLGTLVVLGAIVPRLLTLITLAALDGLIHYHVDWAKMEIGRVKKWRPDNSEWFWILLGFDQLLHGLTYFLIVWLLMWLGYIPA